jgi:hypothetical protein
LPSREAAGKNAVSPAYATRGIAPLRDDRAMRDRSLPIGPL